MQSNCNGLSVVVEQAKQNNGFRKQGGKGNLNFPALAEREMWGSHSCWAREILVQDRPVLFSSHAVIILGILNWVKGNVWSYQAHKIGAFHICLKPNKVREHCAFPLLTPPYSRLLLIFHSLMEKQIAPLFAKHISICHTKRPKKSYTRTITHIVNTLKSSSPVCIQNGPITLVS